MRVLSNQEQNFVSGANSINLMIPVDPNAPINFSTGFQAGVDTVAATAGFIIGVPSAFVILPAQSIYYLGCNIYEAISSYK